MRYLLDPDSVFELNRKVLFPDEPHDYRLGGRGLLEQSLGAPVVTFLGVSQYPSTEERAAVLFRSLSLNHPFAGGNKRTAVSATTGYLASQGRRWLCSRHDAVAQAEKLTVEHHSVEAVLEWVRAFTIQK